jgi:hypothetical protein
VNGGADVSQGKRHHYEELDLTGVESLIQRANEGDETVLPALREMLEARPEIWKYCGDLAVKAEREWVGFLSVKSLLVRESLVKQIEELRDSLSRPGQSALEGLLIDRVIATWFQVHYAELYCVVGEKLAADKKSVSPATAAETQSRASLAQYRHLQAIKTLAMVRKLLSQVPGTVRVSTAATRKPVARTKVGSATATSYSSGIPDEP